MTTVTLTLSPETERKLREKADAAGTSLETYLQRLAEKEASNGAQAPRRPTFEEVSEPFAKAVEASGMSEEQLQQLLTTTVKEVRAEKRAKK